MKLHNETILEYSNRLTNDTIMEPVRTRRLSTYDYLHRREELLNLFPNGLELFNNNDTFNRIIKIAIVEDNLYSLIETLCINIERLYIELDNKTSNNETE